MNRIVDALHYALSFVVGSMVTLFDRAGALAGLVTVSAALGVLLVLVYGKLSNQGKIRAVKRGIHGALLESILFRHDLGLSLKAQGKMLTLGARYFALAVPPLLMLAVPCLLAISQLNLWYGYRPLKVNESLVVRLGVSDQALARAAELEGSPALEVTPPVRIEDDREVWWRIRAKEAGVERVVVKHPKGSFEEPIFAAPGLVPLVTARYREWFLRLLYPESAYKGGNRGALPEGVEAFEARYPEATHELFGFRLHWVVLFFLVSLVSGLLAAKLFGVEV